MLSEQEKIEKLENAFSKFMTNTLRLLGEQRVLFEQILKKVEERKISEHREKIKTIFNPEEKNEPK